MGFFSKITGSFRRSDAVADTSAPLLGSGDRKDGWVSTLGSWGTSRDKRQYLNPVQKTIKEEEAEVLWRGSDIGARIVELPANETLRSGFEIKIPEGKELSEELMSSLEGMNAVGKFLQALHYERAYGGAAIWPVINDGQKNLTEPLNLERISGISHLIVFDTRELKPREYYTSIEDKKLGEPKTYSIQPRSRGAGYSGNFAVSEIHESRLIIFPGIRVGRAQISPNGWGDSIFCRIFEVLRDYDTAWNSASILLHEFSQASMKIQGLAKLLAKDKDKVIRDRIKAVELARNAINMVLMDATEEYERKQTPVAGLRELLDGFAQRVAAAADMPVTLLMGMSPAGLNATGESDIRFFYDRIDVKRQLHVKPRLEYLIKLLMLSKDSPTKGKEPDVWSVQFNPLWQPSDKEVAETRKIVADTDKAYWEMQVVSSETIAENRFGGDTYSMETQIDLEEMESKADEDVDDDAIIEEMKAEAAVEAPEGPDPTAPPTDPNADIQKSVMNGSQIGSMVSVVQQVNENIISRDSGIAILRIAFRLSPQEAEDVIGIPPEKPEPELPEPIDPEGPQPPSPFEKKSDEEE